MSRSAWPPAWMASAVAFIASTRPGSVLAVVGVPRTGKSAVVKAADAAGVWRRRVTFDPYGRRDAPLILSGALKSKRWPGTWCRPADLTRHAAHLLDWSPCRVVAAPDEATDAELAAQFSAVADAVWRTGGVDLIGEEAGRYSRGAIEAMGKLASGGGHASMRLVLVCQSLSWLTVAARRFVSHVVCFAQGAPEDVDALRKRCGNDFADRVRALRGPDDDSPGDGPVLWRLGDGVRAVQPEGAPEGARQEA